ncbi:MAG: hypothetical protein K8963_04995, partial [Proteobacteria bacterium]|nr:hypothetical protein [Pseudomonadota bacterium]
VNRDGNELATDIVDSDYTDSTAQIGTSYSYTIMACNALGCSRAGGLAYPNPPTPQDLTGTAVRAGVVELKWTAAFGATRYSINRADAAATASSSTELANNATTTSYQDSTNFVLGTSYIYNVTACDLTSCSPPQSVTVAYLAPAAPTSLTASVDANGFLLDWADVADASLTHYTVSRDGAEIIGLAGALSTSRYNDEDAVEGNSYTYTVAACNILGCSADISVSADYVAPATSPSSFSATVVSNEISLDWTDVPGVTYYALSRNGTELVGEADATDTPVSTYIDTTADSTNFYIYTLMACNGLGCSPELDLAYPRPQTPQDLTARVVAPGVIDLQWTTALGVANYSISRDGTELAVLTATLTSTSYRDSNSFVLGSSYTYEVVACDVTNCSPSQSLTVVYSTPAQPAALTASIDASALVIDWSDIAGAT